VGSIVIYLIGYTGGEVLLRKRLVARALREDSRFVREARIPGADASGHVASADPFKAVVLAAAHLR